MWVLARRPLVEPHANGQPSSCWAGPHGPQRPTPPPPEPCSALWRQLRDDQATVGLGTGRGCRGVSACPHESQAGEAEAPRLRERLPHRRGLVSSTSQAGPCPGCRTASLSGTVCSTCARSFPTGASSYDWAAAALPPCCGGTCTSSALRHVRLPFSQCDQSAGLDVRCHRSSFPPPSHRSNDCRHARQAHTRWATCAGMTQTYAWRRAPREAGISRGRPLRTGDRPAAVAPWETHNISARSAWCRDSRTATPMTGRGTRSGWVNGVAHHPR